MAVVCPDCGKQDGKDSETCEHCSYTYRYDDLAGFGTDAYRFVVTFECLNCGNRFKRGFRAGDTVDYKAPSAYRRAEIDRVNGNVLRGKIGTKRFRVQCPCCTVDHKLVIVNRTPIEPKSDGN